VQPVDVDPTYPAAFVWFARLIVVGLVVLFVTELVQAVRALIRGFRNWRGDDDEVSGT
jgi:hypothetical protein